MSERRGCAALGVGRSGVRDRSTKPDQAPLRMRICDLAKSRVRYGYFRIYILLRREAWRVNHKRVHRLYRDEGLSLRLKRPRRHVSAAHRERQPAALRPNERWSMDFVSDALFDGRRLRALTVVDAFTREALAIEASKASGSWLSSTAWRCCAEHRARFRSITSYVARKDGWPGNRSPSANMRPRCVCRQRRSRRLLPIRKNSRP